MKTIVTLTVNPCVDRSCVVDVMQPERKLRARDVQSDSGGGGLNVARVIEKLGGDPLAIWTRGGVIGEMLTQLLNEEGVRHEPVTVNDSTRENIIAYEASTGNQYRICMPGPTITDDEAEKLTRTVAEAKPDYLVMSGSLPPGIRDDYYTRVTKAVPSSCRVILDTSGDALAGGLEAPVYLVKPNMNELGTIAGREIESDEDIRNEAHKLIDGGTAEVVLVSLGSGGAVLVTEDDTEQIRPPTVPIRSKVGAGDSTVGAMVYALAQDYAVKEAARMGIAAGAAAVMTEGTQLCRADDAKRLYEQMTSAERKS